MKQSMACIKIQKTGPRPLSLQRQFLASDLCAREMKRLGCDKSGNSLLIIALIPCRHKFRYGDTDMVRALRRRGRCWPKHDHVIKPWRIHGLSVMVLQLSLHCAAVARLLS